MSTCSRIFADICEIFLAVIIGILIFVAVIIGVPLFCPLYIYRYCLKLCFKYFRSDLDKMLTCGNTIMTSFDKIYGLTQNTTVLALTVKGIPEIEEVRAIVTEKWLNAKTEKGIRKYPELMQYPYMWMGYYFWKYEDFDIKNHVSYYILPEQEKIFSEDDIALIETKLGTKPHTKDCSPWEFVIVPNVKLDYNTELNSVIFFRTHHGLMDGFGIIKLLIEELGGEDMKKCGILWPESPKRNILQNILYYSSLVFRVPYDAGYSIVKTIGHTENDFRLEHEELSPYLIGTVPLRIPLSTLKEIRYSHKVGLVSVLTAIWIGGLRRSMIQHQMKIPKAVIFSSPQPMPGHPGKLRNHASAAANMYFYTGIEDPVKRLKSIDDFMNLLKRTTTSQILFMFKPILGSFTAAMIDLFVPVKTVTGGLNVFVGPSKVFSVFGKQVEDFHYTFGQQKAGQNILFSGFTYAGNVNVKIAVNKNRFSEESKVKELQNFVLEELEVLKKSIV